MKVSITIVHYHVKNEIFDAIAAIYASKPKVSFEIIVIDNDEKKTLFKDLHKKFPKVKYIKNSNKGYGQGNNTGAKQAKGEYLFVLNPDTKIYLGCIDLLSDYLDSHKNAAVAAPFLYEANEQIVPFQGAKILTPLSAIFGFSFIHKLFPNNPIVRKYWQFDTWNGKSVKDVESVPGAALMIRKKVFEDVNGFDEKFFLYFEENDLSKRVKEQGWKLVMLPKAKVFHSLGNSMKKSKENISNIFKQSRFYYFKKHFGLLPALVTETVLRTGKYTLLLSLVFAIAFFLRTHNIFATMPFIGDQGWFYLSARDMVITGNIPLVGIESSRPWLHQGALWTYLLAFWFWLFSFHPTGPVFMTAFLDLLAIALLYKFTSTLFSQKTGLFAAALYATSPIAIMNSRIPYHTSPIPLLTIVFLFALYKWMNGNKYFFPVVIFTLALLYNLELAAFLLSIMTVLIVIYGMIKKESWVKTIFTAKIGILSAVGFIAGMLPMLIYDLSHGFPQTIKFLVWMGYRILVFFGYPPINPTLPVSFADITSFFGWYYQKLLFLPSEFIAVTVFSVSFIYLSIRIFIKKAGKNLVFIFCITFFLSGVLFATKMLSEAYLPLLIPTSIILMAVFFERMLSNRLTKIVAGFVLCVLLIGNVSYLIQRHYSFVTIPNALPVRIEIAKEIVKQSEGKEYNLTTQGNRPWEENVSMNYEYLAWWLGNGPVKPEKELLFIINEKESGIIVEKKER